MNCDELESYLHEFIDNELARDKRSEMANHLAACRHCAVKVAELEQVDRELRSLQAVEPTPDFVQQVRRRIREQEQIQATVEEPAIAGEVEPGESLWDALSRRFAVPLWVRVSVSLAAAVVLVFAVITLVQSYRQLEPFEVAQLPSPKARSDLGTAKYLGGDADVMGKYAEKFEERDAQTGVSQGGADSERAAMLEGTVTPAPVEAPKFELAQAPKPAEPRITLPMPPPVESGETTSAGKADPGVNGSQPVPLAQRIEPGTTPERSNATAAATSVPAPPSPMPHAVPGPTRTAKGGAKKPAETLAKFGPAATNVPPGLQSGWLDLATRNFYPELGKTPEAAFIRGYLDAKGKFKLLSTQVEGTVVELTVRQAAAKGTPGWLVLSTQDFVAARPGLTPSFPYIEGYQDNRGEFRPTSRRIHKAEH